MLSNDSQKQNSQVILKSQPFTIILKQEKALEINASGQDRLSKSVAVPLTAFNLISVQLTSGSHSSLFSHNSPTALRLPCTVYNVVKSITAAVLPACCQTEPAHRGYVLPKVRGVKSIDKDASHMTSSSAPGASPIWWLVISQCSQSQQTEFPAGHWAGKTAVMEGATLLWTAQMVGESVLNSLEMKPGFPSPGSQKLL